FCSSCGASLARHVGVHERRVVTALFADLARSTALGERLDPEVVRGIVGRFFELAREHIQRRGGTVEKFSGDAVMAVFGLPAAHEDDPERAVRAALAIRHGVAALAAEMLERHGVSVESRIGIESGEVVVGDPFAGATLATGDAMNLAARLEQLAEPGEIIVGQAAWQAVRGVASGEPLGEQRIRGREATLAGWRISAVSDEVGRPRGVPGLSAPLTGRDEELTMLLDAARRARQAGKAVLFTILGLPGVGKSRLVREATEGLAAEGWAIVRGRCLPYGEGITYWPVAEMLRELAGIAPGTTTGEARERLAAASPEPAVADQLALALGTGVGAAEQPSGIGAGSVVGGSGTEREIAWAFRRLVEHICSERGPLVLVFEDIHWAEPQLLDLIEYLVTWARGAPLLVICPARPELLDARPGWGSGRMEASRIQLEPLSEAESRALLGALLEVEDLPSALRQRVLDRAEGNPLFVEEVVRMLIDERVVEKRDGHWYAAKEAAEVRVPDSVEALIRARLDTLPSAQRSVLQAAAVVGRVFNRSAVVALVGAGGAAAVEPVERHLEDAILRDLITEERSPDEPTFRFRHVLIRDVAYGTLPKARRAELHLQAADWLRAWSGDRVEEFIEIEAYHLEQAIRLRRAVEGRIEPADAERALDALAASALRALMRDDARSARAFAQRALELEPPAGERRLELEWLQVEALRRLGEWRQAGELAVAVERDAAALGRKDIQGRAILASAGDVWISLGSADAAAGLEQLRRARELLAEAGDTFYLCAAVEFLGYGGWWLGDLERAEQLWSELAQLAHAADLPGREAEALILLAGVRSQRGDVSGRRRLLEQARLLADQAGGRLTRARVERAYGGFLATSVSGAEAEPLLTSVAPIFEEFGEREEFSTALSQLGDIRRREGRPAEALELYLRALEPILEHVGYRPEQERRIAQAALDLGDIELAAEHAERGAELVGRDDFSTVASAGMVVGLLREAQGRLDEAEALLREAVTTVERTDYAGWEEYLSLAEF
ncbi:MAG TPA: AAA family ATPase, partial [Candidatus Limnocylindria bacterium]|nr:AAA family ATPase [Candidatus Limnocylindria bacterium]